MKNNDIINDITELTHQEAIIILDKPDYDGNPENDCWINVINDMKQRRQFGIDKYQTPLQAGNNRSGLIDAYQEALDLSVYLKKIILEQETKSYQILQLKKLSALIRNRLPLKSICETEFETIIHNIIELIDKLNVL